MYNRDAFKHYMTGDEATDSSHIELMDALTEFIDKVKKYGIKVALPFAKSALNKMIVHMDEEEILMTAIDYPFIRYHVLDHDNFRNRIKELRERLDSSAAGSDLGLHSGLYVKKLQDDFMVHIDHFDMQLATWIPAKIG
jgi:hemerythrin-like metal-binding protein